MFWGNMQIYWLLQQVIFSYHWLKRLCNYFTTSYFPFMKIHVANSSYGRNLNFQTKGLAYISVFCAQFLELGRSNPPQSLGGKCSISLIITYHNTPVPGVNVSGGRWPLYIAVSRYSLYRLGLRDSMFTSLYAVL